jgi:uncharacterized protein YegL
VNEAPSAATVTQINASYRKTNEYRFHNLPHPWVGGGAPSFTSGGSMSFMASPNDPIFFLHHCNVDRLWAVWQQKHGSPANAYIPTTGGNAGHNLNDVMALFSPPTWPTSATAASVIDHHAIGAWYDTDLPIISTPAGSLNFGDVPAGLTTYRPVQFEVETCRPVFFEITGVGGSPNFSVPPEQGIVTTQAAAPSEPFVTANVYVRFVAPSSPTGFANGSVTVRAYIIDEQGYYAANPGEEFTIGTYTVTLSANSVARPQSAITLVIDRSGSMSGTAGGGTTKVNLLREAVETIADIMEDSDGIGVVSFDDQIERISDVVSISSITPAALAANPGFDPRGLTAIGSGMIEGADVLLDEKNKPGTPYDRHAMIVMSDGNENVPPLVDPLAPPVNGPEVNAAIETFADDVYALGFGAHNNVSADKLGAIANYMLITGDITTAEQRFRLVKYFTQVIAGITRFNIVVDPQGDLLFGARHVIPFQLTQADHSASVIVMSPGAWLINLLLEAPDGTLIGPATTPNAVLKRNTLDTFYRVLLPALPADPGASHGGTWHAILELDRRLKPPQERLSALPAISGSGVPYTMVVQSYSNLTFQARVEKPVSQPGDTLHLMATLAQYEIPLSSSASVIAEVNPPTGGSGTIALQPQGAGLYAADFPVKLPGLYNIRFRARGSSVEGEPFQREETRTAVVLRPSVGGPADGAVRDPFARCFCELLRGLISGPNVLKWLESQGMRGEEILDTVKNFCRCTTADRSRLRPVATPVSPALTPAEKRQMTAAFAVAQVSRTEEAPSVEPVEVRRAPFPKEVHRGMTFDIPEDMIEKPGKAKREGKPRKKG